MTQQTNKLGANGSFVIEEDQADQGEKTKSKNGTVQEKAVFGDLKQTNKAVPHALISKSKGEPRHVCLFANKKMQTSHIWLISYVLQP